MKLCVIGNPNSVHVHRWATRLLERQHEVHLVGEKPLKRPVPQGVVFYDLTRRTNVRKLRYLVWALEIRRVIGRMRPDVLHAHQVSSAGWLGAAAGYHPLVVTCWGSDLLVGARRSRVQRLLARWVLKHSDYVTCMSRELAKAARQLGAETGRLEVLTQGVDREVFRPASPAIRSDLRAQMRLADGPVVLSLRAMGKIYGPVTVAEAIPRVLERVPEANFMVRTFNAEPGILRRFQNAVQAHRVSQKVRFVDTLYDDRALAAQCQVADVAISVASSDGMPVSVLEAMACAVPVVLADIPAFREWFTENENCLLVPLHNPEALAAATVRLLRDENLRNRLGSAGAELVSKRASVARVMQRYEAIYRDLAERY